MVAAKQATVDDAVVELDHPLTSIDRPLTEEDFWALPDDENRYEIIGGELFMTPPPIVDHQTVSQYLSVAFYQAVRLAELGWVLSAPVGVRLGPSDIVQPDIVVISSARSEAPTGKLIIGSPDLVVEILSPSTRRNDRVKKRARYQTWKIGEYWIVDPAHHTVEVLVLEGEQYVVTENEGGIARSQVFPTIEIDVAHLFSGQPYRPATTPRTTG